ncbi:CBS domain-containing protein [Streptomyces sp. NPDC002004]
MRHTEVGAVMADDVVSVMPSTPFKEVAKLLAVHGISGLPVLGDDDRVIGVISESDLLARQASAGGTTGEWPTPRADPEQPTARELMTAPAITVHVDDTVAEAARTMLRRGVERLPVVDEAERLVGIVTRRDLLLSFLRPDPEIRSRVIEDVVVGTLGLPPDAIAVHVVDGVVTLEGSLEDRRDISAVVNLVRRTDGVVSVIDRLTAHETQDVRS